MSDQDITSSSSQDQICKALKPLTLIPAQLHHNLWRDFLTTQNPENMTYNMVNESKTQKLKLAYQILRLCGCETWSEDEIEEYQSK